MAAALVVATVPATPAAAAPRHVPAGRALGEAQYAGVATVDARWAAYVSRDATVHVVDDIDAGRSFSTRDDAGICGPGAVESIAGGGGQLVLSCSGGQRRFDLATRAWSDSPSPPLPPAARSFAFGGRPLAAGRRWLAFEPYGAPRFYADRDTGEVRHDSGAATDVPDLDAPELLRPMCAPLRRPLPAGVVDENPFGVTAYDGETALASSGGMLTVQRCGEPRPTVIARDAGQASARLSGGVVSWSDSWGLPGNLDVFAYLPACRLRLAWSVAAATASAHTRRAVYVTSQPDEGPRVARRIPLPNACTAQPRLPRLRLAGAGRATTLAATGWTVPRWDRATVERMPAPGVHEPATPPQAGRTLTVRTPAPVRGISWGLRMFRYGTARAIRSGGRRWRLALPSRAAGEPLTLIVHGAAPGGGAAIYRARVGER